MSKKSIMFESDVLLPFSGMASAWKWSQHVLLICQHHYPQLHEHIVEQMFIPPSPNIT
jgi:hypothetical protein